MSQLAEKEQGENTDEGKFDYGKDRSDDQDMESHSYASSSSSSCEDLTEPRAGVLSKDMEDVKKDIVNIKEINEEQQKIISELEEKINEVIKNQQNRVSELEEKINEVIKNQQKRISELKQKVKNAEQCQIKLKLWLYGLPEQKREDVRKRVIDICSAAVPEAADSFPHHIDIVHRVGKKSEDRERAVVIKFIARSTKELLWKTVKRPEDFRSSNLWFGEELTAKDKDTRNRLWPQIEAARKEGKRAFFVGAKAIVDGKEISE